MGLTVSAEEIIRDRKILRRESFLNLSWNSYLMSKLFILFTLSAIQTLSFVVLRQPDPGDRMEHVVTVLVRSVYDVLFCQRFGT